MAQSSAPVGLGEVGDVEFWAPNRGLLTTAGKPPTVPAGVWAYNGVSWHELATVCGGGEAEGEGGRIAWAGPEEFFTVSAGRPGQASEFAGAEPPPLVDNTVCRFAAGQVVASYAHPDFQADSYQTMQGAACLGAGDCWFGGDPLSEPQVGAFQLHWNGGALEAEPYPGEGHAIEDMLAMEGRLYESVRISRHDVVSVEEEREPPVLHRINPEGVAPLFQGEAKVPLYGSEELPEALESLSLSAAEGALWGAAGPEQAQTGESGQVTVVRRAEGAWKQLIGPGYPPTEAPANPLGAILPPAEEQQLLGGEAKDAAVSSIAAEPGTGSAWVALRAPGEPRLTSRAVLVRISAEGKVIEQQTLPSAAEEEQGVGPKGSAEKVSCPAANDCWLATAQGWLFHLAPEGERTLPEDEDPNFQGPITYRPPDQGLPQVPPPAPPLDTSGLPEFTPPCETVSASEGQGSIESTIVQRPPVDPHAQQARPSQHAGTALPSGRQGARPPLAKRHGRLVAATATRTLAAGNRRLLLRLDPHRWPTKLGLRTHALAKLPTVRSGGGGAGPRAGPKSLGSTGEGRRPRRTAWDCVREARAGAGRRGSQAPRALGRRSHALGARHGKRGRARGHGLERAARIGRRLAGRGPVRCAVGSAHSSDRRFSACERRDDDRRNPLGSAGHAGDLGSRRGAARPRCSCATPGRREGQWSLGPALPAGFHSTPVRSRGR